MSCPYELKYSTALWGAWCDLGAKVAPHESLQGAVRWLRSLKPGCSLVYQPNSNNGELWVYIKGESAPIASIYVRFEKIKQ